MPTTALIVHATTHGHTGRVAQRIADVMRAAGADVTAIELPKRGDPPGGPPSPTGYDVVVAAGSLHAGKHQRQLVRWIRAHAPSLAAVPSALVSVSLTAAEDSEEARTATRACVDELIDETSWTPDRVLYVAGALQYREYDVATRVLMRLIARRHGQSTDAHEDVEYTDWAAVDAFAQELAAGVARGSAA